MFLAPLLGTDQSEVLLQHLRQGGVGQEELVQAQGQARHIRAGGEYSTVQYSTVRYGTVRYGTVQYSVPGKH